MLLRATAAWGYIHPHAGDVRIVSSKGRCSLQDEGLYVAQGVAVKRVAEKKREFVRRDKKALQDQHTNEAPHNTAS
jgi:hypothetical protein